MTWDFAEDVRAEKGRHGCLGILVCRFGMALANTVTIKSIVDRVLKKIFTGVREMEFKKIFIVAAMAVNSGFSLAADRAATIHESSNLSTIAADLGDDVLRQCNCQNTAQHLFKIGNLAVDVEMEARFGTSKDTTDKFKEVVRTVLNMKKYVRNMHDQSLKIKVRREIMLSVNTLGFALMGKNFPIVALACSSERTTDQCEDQAEELSLKAALSQDPESEFE